MPVSSHVPYGRKCVSSKRLGMRGIELRDQNIAPVEMSLYSRLFLNVLFCFSIVCN